MNFALVLCTLSVGGTFGQAGSLDQDWGTDGVVLTDFPTGRANGRSVLIQPDGKVVMVGTQWVEGLSFEIALARYHSDGTLDASFGSGGRATTDMGGWDLSCYGALQPDGRIVVAGMHSSAFSAMRFLPDGSVDGSFGLDGQVSTNVSSGWLSESVRDILVQADGRILLAGRTTAGDGSAMAIVRYLPDGNLDPDFASGGIWIHQISPLSEQINAILQQSDGKLLGIGSANIGTWPNTSGRFAIVRLNEDGTLDPSFGTDGAALFSVGAIEAGSYSGILQPDGKILATGYSDFPSLVTTIRCSADGTLDQSFGSGGVVATSVTSERAVGKDIVLQPDGKVLVAAECFEGTGQHYSALLRYSPEGVLDEGFGTSGMTTTMFADRSVVPETIVLQADGKPLVGGYSFQVGSTVFFVTRHLNDVEIAIPETGPFVARLLAFPNPLREQLFLRYELSGPDRISLRLLDPVGRIVRTLLSGIPRSTGPQLETLEMRDLAPGHYTLILQGGEHVGQVRVVRE